jgi:hypothetical protein
VRALQQDGAEVVFASHARVLPARPPRAVAAELVARPDGEFQVRSSERKTV